MSEQNGFQLSQGLTILQPRSGQAYPIPCEEWKLIKERISKFSTEPWFFHTLGSVLIGAALSTFITILIGTFSDPNQSSAKIIAWGVVATTAISGFLCLFFAQQERASKREQASDVVSQMALIEQRYEHPPP